MKKNTYLLLSLLVFLFLVLRAIYVPLVHDEIATFFYYIQPFEYNPLTGANPDANNHILNSFLSGISYKLFGYSAWSIRLPNLLSFVVYAFFVFKIGERLTKKSVQLIFYVTLLFSIYFIQFFSLSRGYGMSMAFLMPSFYYILILYDRKSIVKVLLAIGTIILAIYANMSLLPLGLMMSLVVVIIVLRRVKEYLNFKDISLIFTGVLFFGASMYYATKIAFKMKNEGSLYYGELDGFWEITVNSILKMLFDSESILLQIGLILIIFFGLIIYVLLLKRDKLNSFFKSNYLFFYLLIGSVIGIQIMAIFLEVNYPEDRVGMYLFPLLIASLCFGVDRLENEKFTFVLLILFVFPIHFLFSINFSKTSQWQTGYIPNRFYDTIKNHDTGDKYPASVGGDLQRVFIYTNKVYMDKVNHEANMMQFWALDLFDSNFNVKLPEHSGRNFDYLISHPNQVKELLPYYDSIDYADLTKFVLYQRKEKAKKKLHSTFSKQFGGEITDEYVEFYHQSMDSLNLDAFMIGFDLQMQSIEHPFRSRLVVEIRNLTTNEKIDYQYYQLNWMYPTMKQKEPLLKSMRFNNMKHHSITDKIEIVAYLWNIDKKPFTIYKGDVEIYELSD